MMFGSDLDESPGMFITGGSLAGLGLVFAAVYPGVTSMAAKMDAIADEIDSEAGLISSDRDGRIRFPTATRLSFHLPF